MGIYKIENGVVEESNMGIYAIKNSTPILVPGNSSGTGEGGGGNVSGEINLTPSDTKAPFNKLNFRELKVDAATKYYLGALGHSWYGLTDGSEAPPEYGQYKKTTTASYTFDYGQVASESPYWELIATDSNYGHAFGYRDAQREITDPSTGEGTGEYETYVEENSCAFSPTSTTASATAAVGMDLFEYTNNLVRPFMGPDSRYPDSTIMKESLNAIMSNDKVSSANVANKTGLRNAKMWNPSWTQVANDDQAYVFGEILANNKAFLGITSTTVNTRSTYRTRSINSTTAVSSNTVVVSGQNSTINTSNYKKATITLSGGASVKNAIVPAFNLDITKILLDKNYSMGTGFETLVEIEREKAGNFDRKFLLDVDGYYISPITIDNEGRYTIRCKNTSDNLNVRVGAPDSIGRFLFNSGNGYMGVNGYYSDIHKTYISEIVYDSSGKAVFYSNLKDITNSCPSTFEIDDRTITGTVDIRIPHQYLSPGNYKVYIFVEAKREPTMCDYAGPGQTFDFTIN